MLRSTSRSPSRIAAGRPLRPGQFRRGDPATDNSLGNAPRPRCCAPTATVISDTCSRYRLSTPSTSGIASTPSLRSCPRRRPEACGAADIAWRRSDTTSAVAKARCSVSPRSALAEVALPPGRADPVALLHCRRSVTDRRTRPDPVRPHACIPTRVARGAALVMAADLASGPTHPGRRPQLCGDAHLSNLGCRDPRNATWCSTSTTSTRPCRACVEADVKRLVASLAIARRPQRLPGPRLRKRGAGMRVRLSRAHDRASRHARIDVWYAQTSSTPSWNPVSTPSTPSRSVRPPPRHARATTSTVAKLTEVVEGRRHHQPPTASLVPIAESRRRHYRAATSDRRSN